MHIVISIWKDIPESNEKVKLFKNENHPNDFDVKPQIPRFHNDGRDDVSFKTLSQLPMA